MSTLDAVIPIENLRSMLQNVRSRIIENEKYINYTFPKDKTLNENASFFRSSIDMIIKQCEWNLSHDMTVQLTKIRKGIENEIDFLQHCNNEHIATIKRLTFDTERLSKENEEMHTSIEVLHQSNADLADKVAALQTDKLM